MITYSFIIPVYNGEKYISRCIRSILQQDFKNYEIIIVNDGSTDSSGFICEKLSKKYNNIKVIHQENGGQLCARLKGIRFARGEYCLFVDADDEIESGALSIIERYRRLYYFDCLIYGFKIINHNVVKNITVPNRLLVTTKKDLYQIVYFRSQYNGLWRKVVRKDLLLTDGYEKYYKIRLGEDLLESIDIYRKARRTLFITESLYKYHIHTDSTSYGALSHEEVRNSIFIMELCQNEVEKLGEFDYRELIEFYSFCMHKIFFLLTSIGTSKLSIHEKKSIFRDTWSSGYYQNLLTKEYKLNGIKKRIFLGAFNKCKFDLLIYISIVWQLLQDKVVLKINRLRKPGRALK